MMSKWSGEDVVKFLNVYEQWRTRGGSGVQTPPPRNSEGPPKNRAKLNPIVKTI